MMVNKRIVLITKDTDIEGTMIQQIVEDSIENVSETETTSEEKIKMKIKIEEY